jgi:hypothetical protein
VGTRSCRARTCGQHLPELVTTVKNLVVTLLVFLLLIVFAARDPQAMGHIAGVIFNIGARLLNAVAVLLSDLLGGSAH